MRRTLTIIGIALIGGCTMLALCVGGFAYVIVRITQPVADVGGEFLRGIAEADYPTAFAVLGNTLQTQYETPEGLAMAMAERNIHPESWRFNNREINGSTGSLQARVTMIDGRVRTAYLDLRYEGEAWRITRLAFD